MRLTCVEAKQLYDVVGGYQRHGIYDLETANGNEKMLFETYTAPDGNPSWSSSKVRTVSRMSSKIPRDMVEVGEMLPDFRQQVARCLTRDH